MPWLATADTTLYYERTGAGPPLVLLHGFSTAGEIWSGLVAQLARQYDVIVPDLRGHGRSGGAVDTIHHRQFAVDTIALLDRLDLDRAHLVGYSSGGMSLLFVAAQHPERVRSLTLASATYTFDDTAKRHMRFTADEMERQPAAIAAAQRRHGQVHGPDHWKVLRDVFRGFTDRPDELPFTAADLATIRCPTLIVHGDRDPYFPVGIPIAMYEAIPDAELGILPRVGHGLVRDAPEVFLALLQRFLDRVRT
jgi:pimeloyl-ACP methyl ester carboxylesterase